MRCSSENLRCATRLRCERERVPDERIPAHSVLKRRSIGGIEPDVSDRPQVVADLAGGSVAAVDDPPTGDDRGRESRAQVQIDAGIAIHQRTLLGLGACRGLHIGGQTNLGLVERDPQLAAERESVPPGKRWGQCDPVLARDSHRGRADGHRRGPGGDRPQ